MIRIFFCILLFGLLACHNKNSVPDNILPQKQMQSVLWDVIRADIMVNTISARDTSINKFDKNTTLYQQIFKLHGITREQFKQSVDYYRTHPALMQTTLDSLYARASRAVDTVGVK